MLKVTLFLAAAAALAGCVSARDKAVAEIQPELPQLVAACDGAFQNGSNVGLGIVVVSEGIDACDRLAHARSLDLVHPVTAELYKRYRAARSYHAANNAGTAFGQWPASGTRESGEVANTSIQDAAATFPGAIPPTFTVPR
jgi:hypothetical protein